MVKSVISLILFILMFADYIVYARTKKKRKKCLIEKEEAIKTYIVCFIFFIIPIIVIYLMCR